jgi:hypothetical protein
MFDDFMIKGATKATKRSFGLKEFWRKNGGIFE